jgi:chromate transporter
MRPLVLYFLRLGATGFGGPVALVGYMQRDLVERRGWFTPDEYREGLALAQLAPGPLAAQLAMYLGWARGGVLGAALVGLAFVLPSFVMVIAIALLYVRFGGLPWMQGAFYGIGAAVIAVIARSAWRLTRLTLGGDRVHWAIFAAAALTTAWTGSEIVWVFVGAGLVALLAARFRPWAGMKQAALSVGLLPAGLLTGLAGQPASPATLWRIGWYFAEAGAFVFGSGLAIVPFLHGGVVQQFGWLDEQQFLDAVAVAMITPGPVVITVGFIGFLVAGWAGAVVAALGTFLPCYLFTVIPAPHFKRLAQNASLKAFVDGVTAAATGAIAGAVFVLGRRALVDLVTVVVALGTLLVLTRLRRVPEPLLIAGAGLLGVLLAGKAPPAPRTVVFVCEHGSAKSLVAASFFDRMARERGLAVRAVSRGTVPDASVPPVVVRSLRADGFEVASYRPRKLAVSDLASAARVVAIGVDLGEMGAGRRVERWDDIPPVSTSYQEARAAMLSRLDALLRGLE